jgi:hypothetical protein
MPSQLMLYKILGFHSNDYEEWRLLKYYAVWRIFLQRASVASRG